MVGGWGVLMGDGLRDTGGWWDVNARWNRTSIKVGGVWEERGWETLQERWRGTLSDSVQPLARILILRVSPEVAEVQGRPRLDAEVLEDGVVGVLLGHDERDVPYVGDVVHRQHVLGLDLRWGQTEPVLAPLAAYSNDGQHRQQYQQH